MSRVETIRGKDMGFTRISNAEINSRGATTLPNQPQISAAALKQEFDAPAKQIVAPKVNNLMDELEASTSAGNLGAVAPTGRTGTTVQGVINSVSTDLATLEANAGIAIADAHTHDNKALLDTYTQSETDLASAVADDHTHSNKALLDTYAQSETDLADAVSKKHEHSNKSLLDDYTQSNTDIADAVAKKHDHTNKSLLDTYTQANTDLADAVTKKHDHSNKAVLDKFSEVSGDPYYDGNPIGGGGSADAYKSIKVGTTTLTASGADTFELVADENIILTPDTTTTPKQIKIKSTGGGTGSASWGGISGTLSNQTDLQAALDAKANTSSLATVATSGAYSDLSGKPSIPTVTDTYSGASSDGMSGKAVKSAIDALDVSDSAVAGKYVSAVSEIDGKISVTRENLPTVPTNVSDLTNDSGYQTASDVSTAISGKADTSDLDNFTTSVVQLNDQATFDNLDPAYGYDLYYDDDGATGSITVPTWAGTYTKSAGTNAGTIKLAYDITNGTNGTSKWALRILK